MGFRDRDWYIQALDRARVNVTEIQSRVAQHIEAEEFEAAQILLPTLADALRTANEVANQFADKFGG